MNIQVFHSLRHWPSDQKNNPQWPHLLRDGSSWPLVYMGGERLFFRMCQSDKYPNACGRMMTTLSEIALWVTYSTMVDRDRSHKEAAQEGASQSIEERIRSVFGTAVFKTLWLWSGFVFNVGDWTLRSCLGAVFNTLSLKAQFRDVLYERNN